MAETPHFSHFVILLLMGSEFAVAVCVLTVIGAAIARRKSIALLAAGVAVSVVAGYAGVLVGVGWMSGQKTLAPGQWKYFCEADCHIAYSIESVAIGEDSGAAQKQPSSRNEQVAVVLKTWFDQNSIAPWRGNGPLTPSPRRVVLVDGRGAKYLPVPETAAAQGAPSTPMTQPLRPGEFYTTRFVFQVPRDARDLRLLVADTDPATNFIIDHENSPLHGKILLSLGDPAGPRSSLLQ